MTTKKDITGLEDIKLLVDEFYTLVRHDELLSPIFFYRLNVYWEPHLEKMYTFWNAALFGVKGYTGNPFAKHATMPVGGEHFEKWLSIFNTTVDELFSGSKATEAKWRAARMAGLATVPALVKEIAERTHTTSERLRGEVALRESEAKFRTIADTLPQMVWSTLPEVSTASTSCRSTLSAANASTAAAAWPTPGFWVLE